ncbi:hypothetical protein ACH4VR_15235 [Streptomyces sp. NPDC020883]|uniref:hypothetical protein n=1 Tax=Streptomyces sp. NPDC020883 TaxID=3365099 RepID=UPI00378E9A72
MGRRGEGQAGHVVAGIDNDQDWQVTSVPLPSRRQSLGDLPDLSGGDNLVVARTQADHVKHDCP